MESGYRRGESECGDRRVDTNWSREEGGEWRVQTGEWMVWNEEWRRKNGERRVESEKVE